MGRPEDSIAPLLSIVGARSSRGIAPAVRVLAEDIAASYGQAVQAVLVYGSCYRGGAHLEGLVDLYVLVDIAASVVPPAGPRWMLRVLPPAVYYLERPVEGVTVRAKCAWVTLEAFEAGTAGGQFLPYLWGRFAQPAGLVWARDARIRARVHAALARAVTTFAQRVVGALPPRFEARDLWMTGLRLSYGTELRAERSETIEAVYNADREHYERVTEAALVAAEVPVRAIGGGPPVQYQAQIGLFERCMCRLGWTARRALGKLLSILRLAKGLVTFQGGAEYILWKIERHSGVRIELSPFARRHPILAGWGAAWRLYRRGAFR